MHAPERNTRIFNNEHCSICEGTGNAVHSKNLTTEILFYCRPNVLIFFQKTKVICLEFRTFLQSWVNYGFCVTDQVMQTAIIFLQCCTFRSRNKSHSGDKVSLRYSPKNLTVWGRSVQRLEWKAKRKKKTESLFILVNFCVCPEERLKSR